MSKIGDAVGPAQAAGAGTGGPLPHRWFMPWVAPRVLGALCLAELWREGLTAEPGGFVLQVLFLVPLVVAASVLLAVAEQELRAGALTPRMRRWLVWTPRALVLLFAAILALFSLDVVVEGRSAGAIAVGLFLHNLPSLVLLTAALAAWRWPWVGALSLAAFAAWWLLNFAGQMFFPSVFLLLAILPLTVAALFAASALLGGPTRGPGAPA